MNAPYAPSLLAEAKRPSGAGALTSPCAHGRAANAACGDEVDIDLRACGGRVSDVAHRTRGCTFTIASASLLSRAVLDLTIAEARDLGAALRRDLGTSVELPAQLAALAAVRVYPARLRCALLPWDALRLALDEA